MLLFWASEPLVLLLPSLKIKIGCPDKISPPFLNKCHFEFVFRMNNICHELTINVIRKPADFKYLNFCRSLLKFHETAGVKINIREGCFMRL